MGITHELMMAKYSNYRETLFVKHLKIVMECVIIISTYAMKNGKTNISSITNTLIESRDYSELVAFDEKYFYKKSGRKIPYNDDEDGVLIENLIVLGSLINEHNKIVNKHV